MALTIVSVVTFALVVALAPTTLDAQPAGSRAAEGAEMAKRHAVLLVRAGLPVPEETPANSYLGGLPRMPSHFEWPIEAPFGEPRALTFVAQIALAEIPEFPQRSLLPDAGTLYFFVSSDFDGVGEPPSKVLYFEGDSVDLPIVAPPDNVMLLAGDLYYYSRFWLDEKRDPRTKVEFKYPLSFAVTESYPEEERARQIDAWHAALGAPSNHDLRSLYDAISPEDDAWPFNWATAEHIARSVVSSIERDRKEIQSLPTEALAKLNEVSTAAQAWAATANVEEAFAALPAERAAEFRAWWRMQRDPVRAIRKVWPYSPDPDRALFEAIRFAVRLTAEAGTEARALIPPHYVRSVEAETLWQRPEPADGMFMPMHQMFGFGERVQSAPLVHASDVLLLQVKGDPGLAWHENGGCVLQFWIDGHALQTLRLEEAQATLECD